MQKDSVRKILLLIGLASILLLCTGTLEAMPINVFFGPAVATPLTRDQTYLMASYFNLAKEKLKEHNSVFYEECFIKKSNALIPQITRRCLYETALYATEAHNTHCNKPDMQIWLAALAYVPTTFSCLRFIETNSLKNVTQFDAIIGKRAFVELIEVCRRATNGASLEMEFRELSMNIIHKYESVEPDSPLYYIAHPHHTFLTDMHPFHTQCESSLERDVSVSALIN